jgi:trimethylamine:corrinoid methyltransferase-like protein
VEEIGWEIWRDAGRPTVIKRAQHEVERILSTHEVPPLPEDQSSALDEIVQAALSEHL